MISINPTSGEQRSYEDDEPVVVERKLSMAAGAFGEWSERSFAERTDLMRGAADLLETRAQSLGEAMSWEMGKPIRQSVAEVSKCAWVCRYYASEAEGMLAGREVNLDNQQGMVRYDPLGVILAVMPWNFPFWQVFRFAAPTLMAGNVAALKHASNVCGAALAIEGLFRDAGFPDGVFTSFLVPSARTAGLIRDPRIEAVSLTGSEVAGRAVASVAGAEIKKCVLELGGSDPFIVLEDADVEAAARSAATARMLNSGQSCIAAKRFIVVSAVAGRFRDALVEALSGLKVGDPMDPDTDVGPMAREDLREELHGQLRKTVEQGAQLVMGGEVPSGTGVFYPVTLVDRVKPTFVAGSEETFGPMAPIIEVANAGEALRVANSSKFGLGASLWIRDMDRAWSMAAQIESGSVFINDFTRSDPRLPFGGIKRSGYGRELSKEGIREFVNIKTVVGPLRP